MKIEPMFVRYANGQIDEKYIINSFIKSSDNEKSKEIAKKIRDEIPALDLFKRDFINALEDIIDNGINNQFINYINSYMKPSLEEYTEGSGASRTGEKRWVIIKEEGTPWIEALLCYNLTLFLKVNGLQDLKKCPVCTKFFSHKGKYAKYCSETCKGQSGNKR